MLRSFQKTLALLITAALAAFASVSVVEPARAISYTAAAGDPVGLIVKYASDTDADTKISQTLSIARSSYSGLAISYGHSIGLGYHTFSFDQPLTLANAQLIRSAVKKQAGVIRVEIDKMISAETASIKAAGGLRTAVTGASAVRSPQAVDGCTGLCSTNGFVSLTWTKPISFGSLPLSTYRIQYSTNGTTFATKVSSAGKVTSYNVTGLTPGKRYWFKVAAVTKSGTTTKVGAYSPAVSAVPTAKPASPELATERTIYSTDLDPVWYPQTKSQRGGGNVVHYVATATAQGHTTQSCETYTIDSVSYTCALSSKLDAGVPYAVSLTASNIHGVSQMASAVSFADDYYATGDKAWHLKSRFGVNAPGAWAKTTGSKTVTVAVIDSGLTYIPELSGQYFKNANGTFYGYDFVSTGGQPNDGNGWDSNPLDQRAGQGGEWHGTEVASLLAAKADGYDSVGVSPSIKILPVRVLGAANAPISDIVAGILWAAGFPTADSSVPQNIHPADVLNLSIQTATAVACDPVTQDAIYAVTAAGSTIVVAAGNNGDTGMLASDSFPGNCDSTITVGASNYANGRAYYSNRGPGISISAPGGDWSVGEPSDTDALWFSTNSGSFNPVNDIASGESSMVGGEGTSYAAPIVSGVVALMYSVNPDISFYEVYQIISNTAKPFVPLASPNLLTRDDCTALLGDDTCGAGIIDAGRAVAAASRLP